MFVHEEEEELRLKDPRKRVGGKELELWMGDPGKEEPREGRARD